MNRLTSALTMNKAMKTATTTNVSNEETLLENENGSNVHMRTQPRNDDEMILKITKESMMIVKLLILKTTNQLS